MANTYGARPGGPTSDLPYGDFGYLPGVAQAAQEAVYPNPHARASQPYFNLQQLADAQWFTTRVHLSPLGKA